MVLLAGTAGRIVGKWLVLFISLSSNGEAMRKETHSFSIVNYITIVQMKNVKQHAFQTY